MKIFIDSADVKEIREAASLGVVDGVTTNPSLIMKSGRPFKEVALEILSIVDGPISLEVTALECEGMLKEGRELAKLHKNVVVKVPLIPEGLKAVKIFTSEGTKTNVTLCFNANQALLAAKAGASYISPFVGRLDDIGQTGMELISEIKEIYDNYGFATEILVASVRNPIHFKDAALMGADVATVPYSVIKQLLHHPLTDSGLKKFLEDWDKAKK